MSVPGMLALQSQSGESSRSSTPKRPRTVSKAPGVARAIRGMPRPEEEHEVERVEQQVNDLQVQEIHVSQHNYQFNMMVGIDPARLDEVIREGRAMLEESMNRTAHAEQVTIDVHRP